jgi:hypothetical protein
MNWKRVKGIERPSRLNFVIEKSLRETKDVSPDDKKLNEIIEPA